MELKFELKMSDFMLETSNIMKILNYWVYSFLPSSSQYDKLQLFLKSQGHHLEYLNDNLIGRESTYCSGNKQNS